MKKRIGVLVTFGFLVSVVNMQAALVSCTDPSLSTLSALIALGSGTGNGCTIDDKLFNNFNYAPGTGAPNATQISSDLLFDSTAMTYGWEFSPVTGGFIGNFTLGFTVSVNEALCPVVNACSIVNSEHQIFPGTAPPGTQGMSVVDTSNGTPGSETTSLNNLTLAGTIGLATFSGATTITTMATSSGITATQPLLSYQSRVTEAVSPEPITFSLMGISLLGLGMIRRHSRK